MHFIYLIICLSFYIFYSFFSHFLCSYMPFFDSSLSPIAFFLMAYWFITCLCAHLFVHCLHSHYLHVCHLPMSLVCCSSFVVYMSHLHCMSSHAYVTCSSPTWITYTSHVKVLAKLVVLCFSLVSLFIASFCVILPLYLYVQVLKQKARRSSIVQIDFHWSNLFFLL
jgi:hypothetical protein